MTINVKRIFIRIRRIGIAFPFLLFGMLVLSQVFSLYSETTTGTERFIESGGLRTKAVIDFGQMKLMNGSAVGTKTIILRNLTNREIVIGEPEVECSVCTSLKIESYVVPRNGFLKIDATMKLPKEHFRVKLVRVRFPFTNSNNPPLQITLRARAKFSPFVGEPGMLSFGNVFVGREKTLELKIIKPSNRKEKIRITEIKNSDIPFLKFEKAELEHNKILDESKNVFWENIFSIPVTIFPSPNSALGIGGKEVEFILNDLETVVVPILWNIGRRKSFEPFDNVFELPKIEPNESREFVIPFCTEGYGIPVDVKVSGRNLQIVSVTGEGDEKFIKLRFDAGDKVMFGKVGELQVRTEKETHKLDIVLSKTNGLSEDNFGKENSHVGGQSNMEEIPKAER